MTARQQVSDAASWHWGELLYVEADQARELPRWARWLIDFGDWLASCSSAEGVVRAVVSVPTRRFAGVLAAAGIVTGAARRTASRDPAQQLARLAALSRNTPVRYREGNSNKASSGRFDEVAPERGEDYVRLIGGYRRAASQCTYIEPLPQGCDPFLGRREICPHPDFVGSLSGQDAVSHAFPQQIECTIVGTKSTIQEEFGLPLRVENHNGTLQDVARPAEMQQHPADGYRSRIVSALADPKTSNSGDPQGAVVLDGASAILRWRHAARAHPWLAVLDRTSSSADPAVSALLQERASSEDLSPPVGEAPPGIETLCYVEARP